MNSFREKEFWCHTIYASFILILLNKFDMVKHCGFYFIYPSNPGEHILGASLFYTQLPSQNILPGVSHLKWSLITPQIIIFPYYIIHSYKVLQYSVKCKIRTLGRDTLIAQKFGKANICQCPQQSEIPMEVDIVDILSYEAERQAKAIYSPLISVWETEIMEVSHQRDCIQCNVMEQIINPSVDCHSATSPCLSLS